MDYIYVFIAGVAVGIIQMGVAALIIVVLTGRMGKPNEKR